MNYTLNQDVLHALNQGSRFVAKSLNIHLKEYGLFASQWTIMYCLHKFGPMTQTDIWKYVNVEAPTVTRTLTKLEKNGWILRTQGKDKRERIIALTDEAKENFPAIKQTIMALEDDLLAELSLEEKEQLVVLLSKIHTRRRDVTP